MISVDADEVTPNTEYTCNITGRILAFTGVQLGKFNTVNLGGWVGGISSCCL